MNNPLENDYYKIERFNRIYVTKQFFEELAKHMKGYSKKAKFEKWLADKISMLDISSKDLITSQKKSFEPIDSDVYCMTYRHSEKNIRILFQITKVNNNARILLTAFDEKKTKSDYSRAKKNATQRKYIEE